MTVWKSFSDSWASAINSTYSLCTRCNRRQALWYFSRTSSSFRPPRPPKNTRHRRDYVSAFRSERKPHQTKCDWFSNVKREHKPKSTLIKGDQGFFRKPFDRTKFDFVRCLNRVDWFSADFHRPNGHSVSDLNRLQFVYSPLPHRVIDVFEFAYKYLLLKKCSSNLDLMER